MPARIVPCGLFKAVTDIWENRKADIKRLYFPLNVSISIITNCGLKEIFTTGILTHRFPYGAKCEYQPDLSVDFRLSRIASQEYGIPCWCVSPKLEQLQLLACHCCIYCAFSRSCFAFPIPKIDFGYSWCLPSCTNLTLMFSVAWRMLFLCLISRSR